MGTYSSQTYPPKNPVLNVSLSENIVTLSEAKGLAAQKGEPIMSAQMGAPQRSNNLKPCDLVMKGGITSGIVYPPTLLQLKEQYTFRNIGGTSAGAIAAAGAAAAEFRRNNGGG